ncbi:MAG: hypothetical protein NUV82_03560 [Candidatus Komeilibacteria bacterium]|nr:hypothetical protein [Candidatus Komeilibacteria bacterium]
MFTALRAVFSHRSYVMMAITFALFFYFLFTYIHNFLFVRDILRVEALTAVVKAEIIASSLLNWQQSYINGTAFIIIIVLVLLLAANSALMIYYLRRRIRDLRAAGTGVASVLSAVVGIGCGACGSVILTSVFSFSLSAAIMGWLPLNGSEFQILAIVIVLWSLYLNSIKIVDPATCKVKL